MRSKSVKPSLYPPVPFHTIRTLAFLCAIVVAIILAVFIYNLHKEGYKLPWAFLILIISAVLSLTNITVTTMTHCCYGLSPRLSLGLNALLLILWSISLGLLSWSMAHTILTSCTTRYWGNATGMGVCRVYKTLFAFTAAGAVLAIAAVWLDVVVRRRQTRLGQYDPMGSSAALGGDVKLQDRSSVLSAGAGGLGGAGGGRDGGMHGDDAFNDVPDPDPVYTRKRAQSGGDTGLLDEYRGGDDARYYGEEPGWNQRGGYGADDDGYGHGYMAYPGYGRVPDTGYDPGAYR
ncbi:hypothetical protein PHISP_05386 [Aspergillus sp. HF37]|nr:hypothetical protein PHISP_05386 [Aspergillus sp. HF37]